MKLEDLLECSAEKLEAMTDAELLEWFKPFLNVTRPEFAPRPKAPTNKPVPVAQTPQFAAKIRQLQEMGMDINLDDFKKNGKGKKR